MAAKGPVRGAGPRGGKQMNFKDKEKPTEIRLSNITAAKGLTTRFLC